MAMVATSPGASAGGGQTLQDLIAQFGQAQTDANNAGQAQYKNLLNSVAATQSSILGKHGYLTNAGNQARADTQTATANSMGQAQQGLINSGLNNSTIRSSTLAGIQNKGQQSLNNIDEAVAGQKAGMSMDLGKLNADSILSRQNQGPDMNMYLQLIQHLASMNNSPTKSFSNAGSINALNGPSQYSSAPAAPAAPVANTGQYYNAATMGGGLARPGDQFFGGSY